MAQTERRRRELCVTVFERRSTEAKPAEGRPWPSDDDDDDDDDDLYIIGAVCH